MKLTMTGNQLNPGAEHSAANSLGASVRAIGARAEFKQFVAWGVRGDDIHVPIGKYTR